MEIFCKDLRNQEMKITNFEKKKEIILINEKKSLMKIRKIVLYAEKNFVQIKTI